MKRKILTTLLSIALSANIYAADTNIIINGESIALDNPVKIVEDRSYVPLREIGEKILNADVFWDAVNKNAVLKKDDTTIIVPLGAANITINGRSTPISSPAFVENGITYVPMRAITEGFNYSVSYSGNNISVSDNKPKSALLQFSALDKGENIAIIHTDYGDIKVRFFPEYAPKAVENFITHSKDGYFNGITFHRVINNFVIQSGDPTATGMGGRSIWRRFFENEVTDKLRNFRGALCMANSGPDTNGSQFYIVQNNKLDDNTMQFLKNQLALQNETGTEDSGYSNEVLEKYIEIGGAPYLDYNYTVFGQVIEGMNVVDTIAAAETDDNDKPIENVVITNVEIIKYNG